MVDAPPAQRGEAAQDEERGREHAGGREVVQGRLAGRGQRHPGLDVEARGDEHDRQAIGDRQHEERGRLEHRDGIPALAEPYPGEHGHGERRHGGDRVEHEVERRRDDARVHTGHEDGRGRAERQDDHDGDDDAVEERRARPG